MLSHFFSFHFAARDCAACEYVSRIVIQKARDISWAAIFFFGCGVMLGYVAMREGLV